MKAFLIRRWYVILLTILGISSGFLYWRYIGCNSGTCPITSHWHTSSVVGGVMGYLIGSMIFDWMNRKSGK